MKTVKEAFDAYADQGWDDQTQLALLANFVETRGWSAAFESFLESHVNVDEADEPGSPTMDSLIWVQSFFDEHGQYPTAIDYADAGFAKEGDGQCDCQQVGDCVLAGWPGQTTCNRQCYANQLRDTMKVITSNKVHEQLEGG